MEETEITGTDGLTDDERRRQKFDLTPAERADAQNQPGAYPEGSDERNEALSGSQDRRDEENRNKREQYDRMKAEDLRAEVLERNRARSERGAPIMSISGSKAELIERLTDDDSQAV